MKTQIHEVKRMQQLAGVINESQLNEISIDNLDSMVKDNSLVMIMDNIVATVSKVKGINEKAAIKLIDDALDRIESGNIGSDVNLNPKRSSFYN
jgi:predicted thioesterase